MFSNAMGKLRFISNFIIVAGVLGTYTCSLKQKQSHIESSIPKNNFQRPTQTWPKGLFKAEGMLEPNIKDPNQDDFLLFGATLDGRPWGGSCCEFGHLGVDYDGTESGTNIYAIGDGVVKSIYKNLSDYRDTIVIEHELDQNFEDTKSNKVYSVYTHTKVDPSLHSLSIVQKGDVIAKTWDFSSDETPDRLKNLYTQHLHFIMYDEGYYYEQPHRSDACRLYPRVSQFKDVNPGCPPWGYLGVGHRWRDVVDRDSQFIALLNKSKPAVINATYSQGLTSTEDENTGIVASEEYKGRIINPEWFINESRYSFVSKSAPSMSSIKLCKAEVSLNVRFCPKETTSPSVDNCPTSKFALRKSEEVFILEDFDNGWKRVKAKFTGNSGYANGYYLVDCQL